MLEDIQALYMPKRVIVYGKNGNQNLKNIIPFVGFYSPEDDGSENVGALLPTLGIIACSLVQVSFV